MYVLRSEKEVQKDCRDVVDAILKGPKVKKYPPMRRPGQLLLMNFSLSDNFPSPRVFYCYISLADKSLFAAEGCA